MALFPQVMISSTDIAFNLTVYNASSGEYSLESYDDCGIYYSPNVLVIHYLELLCFPETGDG